MLLKKVLCLILIFVLAAGIALPASGAAEAVKAAVKVEASGGEGNGADEANAKISKDEAVKIAAKVLKDYFEFDANDKKYETRIEYREDYRYYGYGYPANSEKYVWQISYNANTNEKSTGINVAVDGSTGKVVNFDKYEHMFGQEQPQVASITEDQAKEIAESFFARINPEEFKQVEFQDESLNMYYYGGYPAQYFFRYVRKVNGIKFDNDGLMARVDGVSGKISSYGFMWSDDITFPKAEGFVEKEKAREIFLNETDMVLKYVPYGDYYYDGQPKAAKLAYAVNYKNGYFLDAIEGRMINPGSSAVQVIEVKDLTESEKKELAAKVKAVKKSNKEIDSSKASEIITAAITELYGAGYEIDSLGYEEDGQYSGSPGKKVWSAQLRKKDESPMYYTFGSIRIDALTGQILSVFKHSRMDMEDATDFEPKLTWEEAYYRALDVLAEYFPDKIDEIKTEQTYTKYFEYYNGKKMPQRTYYFNFPRTVNGILYQNNSLSVSFDIKTGMIRDLNSNWDDIDFPSEQNVITVDEARNIYIGLNEPELAYTLINTSPDPEKAEMSVKLVYRLKSVEPYFLGGYIDAFSGNILNYAGEETDKGQAGFKESIKGHWAEKELSILAYQRIFDIKDFKPDKEVTRLDAVKMLVNAKGYRYYTPDDTADDLKFTNISKNDANYRYLKMAVKYGVIENAAVEFKGDEKITREDMAVMLVKLLGYEKLAKAVDIFTLDFSDAGDISPDKKGYVAIGKGLKIIDGYNGKFRPRDIVTLPEFAVAIYKALGSIKDGMN